MPLSPNEYPNYVEDIRSFTFRDQGSLKIPKEWRERAFLMQVDIKIVSVARDLYLSYKSVPANGFYGYAVLVFRDYCQIEVPISLARQCLYHDRVSEAFSAYDGLFRTSLTNKYLVDMNNLGLVAIGNALGISYSANPIACIPQPKWIELPLREIYIKCPNGTQFEIEVSRWRLFTPLILDGGCEYDGKSGQIDGDKDKGLPPKGIQPNKAKDPNDPFKGFPPASSITDLGDFYNSNGDILNPEDKIDFIDNPDPDNAPKDPPFTSGQCIGDLYRVRILGVSGRTGASPFRTQFVTGWDNIRGKITSIRAFVDRSSSNPDNWSAVGRCTHGDGSFEAEQRLIGGYGADTFVEISEIVVSRMDGGTDNCGDPPIQF